MREFVRSKKATPIARREVADQPVQVQQQVQVECGDPSASS
jgi:hypothetical protein